MGAPCRTALSCAPLVQSGQEILRASGVCDGARGVSCTPRLPQRRLLPPSDEGGQGKGCDAEPVVARAGKSISDPLCALSQVLLGSPWPAGAAQGVTSRRWGGAGGDSAWAAAFERLYLLSASRGSAGAGLGALAGESSDNPGWLWSRLVVWLPGSCPVCRRVAPLLKAAGVRNKLFVARVSDACGGSFWGSGGCCRLVLPRQVPHVPPAAPRARNFFSAGFTTDLRVSKALSAALQKFRSSKSVL